jgi:hypothetical protein
MEVNDSYLQLLVILHTKQYDQNVSAAALSVCILTMPMCFLCNLE